MKETNTRQRLNFSMDLRLVALILAAIILIMFALWRPWSSRTISDLTIQVSGQATLTAEPDEYVFYPTYEVSNADKNAALAEISKKSDEIVKKLKELGVA